MAKEIKVGDRVWVARHPGACRAVMTARLNNPPLPGYIWEAQIEGESSKFPYKKLHRLKRDAIAHYKEVMKYKNPSPRK